MHISWFQLFVFRSHAAFLDLIFVILAMFYINTKFKCIHSFMTLFCRFTEFIARQLTFLNLALCFWNLSILIYITFFKLLYSVLLHHNLFVHSSVNRYFIPFLLLFNNMTMKILAIGFLVQMCKNCLHYIPRSRIVWLKGKHINECLLCLLLSKCSTVYLWQLTNILSTIEDFHFSLASPKFCFIRLRNFW